MKKINKNFSQAQLKYYYIILYSIFITKTTKKTILMLKFLNISPKKAIILMISFFTL